MDRRTYLVACSSVGVAATAGCSAVAGSRRLTDPSVDSTSPSRRALVFTTDGEEIGTIGVDGDVSGGHLHLSTRISHREGTLIDQIRLRVWMPDSGQTPADVALVSPVEGDSSVPPSVTLSSSVQAQGTVIEITELGDLADETISTLDLIVRPRSGAATTLRIDATVDLSESGMFGRSYTLDGDLGLEFPDLTP